MHATFFTLRGRPPSLRESLLVGIKLLPMAIPAALLMELICYAGYLLLFAPGVVFTYMFFVTLPALAVEQDGIVSAGKRSAFLTRGSEMQILSIYFTIQILFIYTYGHGELQFSRPHSNWLALGLVVQAARALLFVIFAILSAVTYHELRSVRDDHTSFRDVLIDAFD